MRGSSRSGTSNVVVLARQSLIALLALIAAFPSWTHATIYTGTAWDLCTNPVSAGGNDGWTITGSPTVTTSVEAGNGNLCGLRIAPSSGQAQSVSPPAFASSVSSARLTCRITPTASGSGSCTREVASFLGSGGDWSGKAALVAMKATGSGVTLQAYYGSTTQKVCNGSLADGKQCTSASDCPEARPGAAQCAVAAFAASPVMTIGQTYEFTLTQDNGSGSTAGTVTVGLYQGAAGDAPAVYERGTRARIVAKCSGGTNDLAPCNVTSECPSGTCSTANVVAVQRPVYGSSDTTACAPSFTLDKCWVYDGTVIANWRWDTLQPSSGTGTDANWSIQGAANAGLAVDDGNAPDGDTTYLYKESTGSGSRIDVPLANPATPLPTPVVGVIFEALAKDNETTASRTMDVRLDAYDGTNRTSGTHATTIDWGDDGASAAYYPIAPESYTLAPDGGAFDVTDLQNLYVAVNRSATTHTTNSVRVTSVVAGYITQTADPTVPTVIADQNGDGEDTLCYFSDSTWNNDGFKNAIVAENVEADNIYFYTRDGAHIGDTAAELALAVEGSTGTFLGLEVMRGASGHRCDLLFISGTVNWFYGQQLADPTFAASLRGIGQPGFCEQQGGPQQGANCYCPTRNPKTTNLGGTPAPNITPGKLGCINNGAFRGTPIAVLPGYCPCTTDADCTHGMTTPGPTHSPGKCNTPSPFLKYCSQQGDGTAQSAVHTDPAVNASAYTRRAWALPGCDNATGCSGGWCAHRAYHSDLENVVEDIKAAIAALTPSPPKIVWVVPPHLARREDMLPGTDQTYIGLDYTRALFRRQTYFIDLASRVRQKFPEHGCAITNACTDTEDLDLCFRDGAHWTLGCELEAANVLDACSTVGGSDGVCTGTVCTSGLVGNACAANADCDIRRCP